LFYVGITGAYFSFLLQQITEQLIDQNLAHVVILLFPLPFVSLCFTYIVLQHHVVIGRLTQYIRLELSEDIKKAGLPHVSWDTSRSLQSHSTIFHRYRLVAQGAVLALPLLYHFYFFANFWKMIFPRGGFGRDLAIVEMFVAIIMLGFVIYLHIAAYGQRRESSTLEKLE
jgi:hypothetical protein